MLIESDRRYRFLVPPDEFWSVLQDVPAWPRWWPWLHDLRGSGLGEGASVRGRIRPPLPYSLDVRIEVVEAHVPSMIAVTVGGDITGTARVDVEGDADGCEVRLTASLGPARPSLRLLANVAPGVARRGHDWVLDTGARQFRSRAL